MTRTVAEKMGVRAGARAHVVGAPAEALAALRLPGLEHVADGEVDYAHLFVTRQEELRAALPPLRDRLATGGTLWVSWPKGGRLGTDLTIRSVIALGYDAGLVESTCLRVDDTWAALRFTRPKPGKAYHNSYGTLPGG
ncbi:Protein of unknown function [Georgenia satyanarayanai]|uniref:DUF3052 domain-containing protein n=1 Tax=Georgenia satyanarayanai TaxID=860221 RepID=A0A2Y9BUZ4_9MICO|nr:hypothetical protein [Georgenia satyanarayanai]PYG01712.1 Protein of unknown function (DUF3052) [Georgenia satyanarayanai]SSA36512.1 Protein of unknown function [Georgenia satyanarayanai]